MLKPCVEHGCSELVGRGDSYCPLHAPEPWAGSVGVKAATGITERQWQRIRRQVIRRDKGRCVICGAEGRDVDHIIPLAHGGTNHLSNLRYLCQLCHIAETARIPRIR